jgi:hypothetical protein
LERLYSVETMPVTLLVDREGRIATTHEGVVEKDASRKN